MRRDPEDCSHALPVRTCPGCKADWEDELAALEAEQVEFPGLASVPSQ